MPSAKTRPETVEVEIRPYLTEDDGARDALVRGSERGSFFHLCVWRDFVQAQYGHEPRELGAWNADRLVGILPMMICRGLGGSRKLVSIPYSVYGGPVGEDRAVEAALIEEARKLAVELEVRYLELRCEEDPGLEMPGTDLYCTFRRELPEDPAEVLERMPKKSRAEVRKARDRHGLVLSEGSWYAGDLYRLFLNNKHALGSPAPAPEHFKRLMHMAPEDVYIHLVSHEREPVSAVMSFAFEDTLIAFYAGTAEGADRAFSASNFMYAALQEWASREGFKTFDFCRSRRDSGAYHFKVHQGFEATPLNYRYHLVRAKRLPSFTPSNPRTAILRNTWSKLPLWMVKRLGRRLYKYLT